MPTIRYDRRVKRLIVTADDFGVSSAVNEAVEDAHRRGILSAASLMVTGDAAADAIARAKRLPLLGVGLHLVLVDGRPQLPPEQVPDLVDADGRFSNALAAAGARLYFTSAARRQAAAEIRAQLLAFRATGLPLDHVNAHHHFHFHPVVRDILLALAPEFGIRAVRLPREPRLSPTNAVVAPFVGALRRKLDRAGIVHNDWEFGLTDNGAMTATRIAASLARLPEGVTELYSHPSSGNTEHAALIDPAVVARVRELGLAPIPFAAL